jgi:hypothetical protein
MFSMKKTNFWNELLKDIVMGVTANGLFFGLVYLLIAVADASDLSRTKTFLAASFLIASALMIVVIHIPSALGACRKSDEEITGTQPNDSTLTCYEEEKQTTRRRITSGFSFLGVVAIVTALGFGIVGMLNNPDFARSRYTARQQQNADMFQPEYGCEGGIDGHPNLIVDTDALLTDDGAGLIAPEKFESTIKDGQIIVKYEDGQNVMPIPMPVPKDTSEIQDWPEAGTDK